MSSSRSPKEFRVALINPPYFERFSRSQRSPGVIKSGTMYYPYWLAHAAAVLDQKGFDIFLYDCPASNQNRSDLFEGLKTFKPDLCVLETSTASSENDLELAEEIKKQFPAARVCMVGTHVTALWQEIMNAHPAIDFVAIGEYDYIVSDLAESLLGETQNFSKIPALAFRLPSGEVARGPLRPPIENVDELPWIAPIYKRFLKTPNYFFSLASHPMVMLIGGRGCVAKCTYCVYPQVMHGHRYRTRSPKSIVGEMKWIQDNMPEVKEIVFEDDTFTGDREFAKQVAELVKQYQVKLQWFANVRTNVDLETLALMKEAGFRCCATGFESGDDILLKNMWKGQTVEAQKKFIQNCKKLGILVHGCFMVGFPGESQETMQKTLDLAIELSPDSAQFYPVMPFPGTTYYIWAKENGFLATNRFSDWLNHEGGHRCVLNLPGLSPEKIEKFCEKAYMRFHFRPKYLFYKLKQAFKNKIEGIRSVRSFLYYIVYLFINKRDKTIPFLLKQISVPSNWYSVHPMPKGRMFEQSSLLVSELKEEKGESKSEKLEALSKRFPKL